MQLDIRCKSVAGNVSIPSRSDVNLAVSATQLHDRGRALNRLTLRLNRLALSGITLFSSCSRAAEGPFFITYTHQLEEPGNLEIATKNVTGKPGTGNRFVGATTEFEYGVEGWWTSELYLDGQSTAGESTLFTGYRW